MGDYVQMKGNNIHDHYNGLLIDANGVIGEQAYHGNKWCGSYADVDAKHLGNIGIVEQSPFFIDPNLPNVNGCDLLPQINASGNWFIPQNPPTGISTFLCTDVDFDACGPGSSPGTGRGR